MCPHPLNVENFPKLLEIKKIHNKVGHSGHLKGVEDAIAL